MDWDDNKLEELYHQVIRRHEQDPYKFFEDGNGKKASVLVNNSMCGDRYQLWVELEDNILKVGGFHGYGCSISKAAGSVLLSATDGRSKEWGMELLRLFLTFIEGGNGSLLNHLKPQLVQEILAFGGVQRFPARKKCVVLIAGGYLDWLMAQD